MHMQRAVDQIKAMRGEVLQAVDLRRIAPTYLVGIDFRGTFDFDSPLADRVRPSQWTVGVNELRSA